jgi:hypothetical protein
LKTIVAEPRGLVVVVDNSGAVIAMLLAMVEGRGDKVEVKSKKERGVCSLVFVAKWTGEDAVLFGVNTMCGEMILSF